MRNVTIYLCLILVLFLQSCQKDLVNQAPVQPQNIDESHYYTPSKEYLVALDAMTKPTSLQTRAACDWVEVPAGSTDALAKAVNDVCAGGVIYLKSGVHTENKAITISKSVNIVGAAGAILKVKSVLSVFDDVKLTTPLKPAIHFLNAPRSSFQNIEIQPVEGDGSTALLFENSNESAVLRTKISRFQSAVMVEKSDRIAIMFNTIVCSSSWQTAAFPFGESIVIINGKSAYISDNDVSNALFGIWPCDEWGTCERNFTHGNYLGVILCNVPGGGYQLPSGRTVGAQIPTKGCKVRNNNSTDNQWGYLVIDGANNNIIENNNAARNAAYDIELTTDSYRFGFLTPKSFKNTVIAGSYPNIKIKDCGENNSITGGIKVNTTTDPCN